MSPGTASDAGLPGSVIVRTARAIRELIQARKIAVNGALPNFHELCTEFGVSYMTVHRGMALLERDGLVRRVRGKGTFLIKAMPTEARVLQHIGIIYPSSRGSLLMNKPWLSEIMRGVSEAAPRGGDLHIFSIRTDGLVNAAHLQRGAVDGVILLEFGNDDYLRAFASWGTPGVVVDYVPGPDVPLDHVAGDNAGAAARVVEHLASLGHRRVAVAMGHQPRVVVDPRQLDRTLLVRRSSDAVERRDGALRALRERGLQAIELAPAEVEAGWEAAALERLLALRGRPDRPTALLVDSDLAAEVFLRELAAAGLHVPEELSLCAIAGCAAQTRLLPRPPTCCHIDFEGMGRWAVERLAARCRQPGLGGPLAQRIGFSFAAGPTSGPAPGPA